VSGTGAKKLKSQMLVKWVFYKFN